MSSLLIRNGLLITANENNDITTADLRIEGSRIVELGRITGPAERSIDAAGLPRAEKYGFWRSCDSKKSTQGRSPVPRMPSTWLSIQMSPHYVTG